MPPRIPHVTPEMARSARDHFQHLYDRPLSEEDGREMAVNVLGAFGVLLDWRARPVVPPEQQAPASKIRGPKRRPPKGA